MEFPEPNEQLYRKSSQNKLSVIKQRRDELNRGLISGEQIRTITEVFFDKKLNEFEEILIHIEELNYSYTQNHITHDDYIAQHDAFRVRLETVAGQALDTNQTSRFLEEQLTAELLKGVPPQDWRTKQIGHSEAMKVLEDILRRNTFEDEDTQPGKRYRQFRPDVIKKYRLRLTLPASDPKPGQAWLPPSGFVNEDPDDPNNINYLLDQITGIWYDEGTQSSELTAAHIVPHKFVGKPLESLCGITEKEIHHFRNGLLMHKNLESAFDKGIICFVPENLIEPIQWKCIVVKTSMMNRTFMGSHNFSEVHNKTLTFLTNDRPSRTACYFRFLMAWLRATAAQRMGIEAAHNFKGLRFVTPTKMVDESVLSALALHVGDKKDWADMQASQGHTFYQGSNVNTPTLAQLQGIRLGGILLMLTVRHRKLEEGEALGSDDDD